MKLSIAQGYTLRRIAACRHSLSEASGRLRKHLNTHRHRMGNKQSSTVLTESVKPVDGDIEAPTAAAAVDSKPDTTTKSRKSEASTQTEPVEEGGYDMRAPRRKRKLFGVVTLVGEKGESSVLPSSEDRRQPHCMLALIKYLRRLVRRVCDCSWVYKM